MSVEKYNTNQEFDSKSEFLEVEKKLVPLRPEQFDHLKSELELDVIEQIYLSHPDEEFSLRLRECLNSDGSEYTATLKDRGQLTAMGIARMEITTPISPDLYAYYKSHGTYPALRKLRAHPAPGVTIDWSDGSTLPIVEIEDLATLPEAQGFYEAHRDTLRDESGSPSTSSEQLAHSLSPDLLPPPAEDVDVHEIVASVMRLRTQGKMPVVAITGRSGSGKSTITNQLLEMFGSHISAVRLSTDDYHVGKTWLELTYGAPWTNWDAPEVYDTKLLACDLERLAAGIPVEARRFDFASEEPVVEGLVEPSDVVIVEGIYAGSPDLEHHRDLHITIPTPLATCIGRRLARDQKEGRLNSSLGNPADILRYQLELAEPMYRQQTR